MNNQLLGDDNDGEPLFSGDDNDDDNALEKTLDQISNVVKVATKITQGRLDAG